MQIGYVKTDLSDYGVNIEGSEKSLQERLLTAWYIKQNGEAWVPGIAGECSAVVEAIKKVRPYIEEYNFKVITNHSALKWLFSRRDQPGRLSRRILELQQWDSEVINRKSALH